MNVCSVDSDKPHMLRKALLISNNQELKVEKVEKVEKVKKVKR